MAEVEVRARSGSKPAFTRSGTPVSYAFCSRARRSFSTWRSTAARVTSWNCSSGVALLSFAFVSIA